MSKNRTTPHPTPTLSGNVPFSAASLEMTSQLGSSPDHLPSSMHFRRNGPTRWNCGKQWYSMELPNSVELFEMMMRPFSIVPGDLQSIAVDKESVISKISKYFNGRILFCDIFLSGIWFSTHYKLNNLGISS